MWDKFDDLFGKVLDEFKILQLDVELTTLSPNVFSSIEDLLVQFKSLLTILQVVVKQKKIRSVFLILSNLRGPYPIFSSSFYSTMDALGTTHLMPSLNIFLIDLQEKNLN